MSGDATREKPFTTVNIGYGVSLDTRAEPVRNLRLTATMRVPDVEGWTL
jgi:hypothetical protein